MKLSFLKLINYIQSLPLWLRSLLCDWGIRESSVTSTTRSSPSFLWRRRVCFLHLPCGSSTTPDPPVSGAEHNMLNYDWCYTRSSSTFPFLSTRWFSIHLLSCFLYPYISFYLLLFLVLIVPTPSLFFFFLILDSLSSFHSFLPFFLYHLSHLLPVFSGLHLSSSCCRRRSVCEAAGAVA